MRLKRIYTLNDFYAMYRNNDNTYLTLDNGELFLSYPKCFNDPFDCLILINEHEFKKEFVKRKIDKGLFEYIEKNLFGEHTIFDVMRNIELGIKCDIDIYKDVPNSFKNLEIDKLELECKNTLNDYLRELDKVRNQFGIACFTINRPDKNMVMWSSYADRYDGICVRYNFYFVISDINTKREDKYTKLLLDNMKKVKYTNKFETLNVSKLLDIQIDKVVDDPYIKKFIKKILNVKYKQWEYEQEYRLILDKNNPQIKKVWESENGFKIKFGYLREIYCLSSKQGYLKMKAINAIAEKYKITYKLLTTSKGEIKLVEDNDIVNKYNIDIMLKS